LQFAWLVTQQQDLGVLPRTLPAGQPQPRQHADDEEIHEPKTHGHPSCGTARGHLVHEQIHITAGHMKRMRLSAHTVTHNAAESTPGPADAELGGRGRAAVYVTGNLNSLSYCRLFRLSG
jgi:hypothetical protein